MTGMAYVDTNRFGEPRAKRGKLDPSEVRETDTLFPDREDGLKRVEGPDFTAVVGESAIAQARRFVALEANKPLMEVV